MRRALSAGSVMVLAFLVRCRFIADVFLPQRILPFDPDTSYHLWRISSAVHNGRAPRFDPFLNAPFGGNAMWPDGFDMFVATVVRIFFGARADRFHIESVAMFVMPMLGALAVLAVYFLARAAFGHVEAIVAMLFAAILPMHIFAAILGHVDHHVLEVLLPPLAALALTAKSAHSNRLALAAGCIFAALVYGVPSVLLHVGVISAALVVVALLDSFRGADAESLLRRAAWALAIAAVLIIPDALSYSDYLFYQPSRLPLVVFVAGSLTFAAFSFAARRSTRALLFTVAGAALLGIFALAAVLPRAAAFIGREGVLTLVTESQPITSNPYGAIESGSALLIFVPILCVIALVRRSSATRSMVALLGLIGFVLGCFQMRFWVYLAPNAAILFGAATVEIWRTRGVAGRALLSLVLIAALAPPLHLMMKTSLASAHDVGLLEASEWLAAHSRDAGPREPGAHAPYSVLTMWGDGAHVAYLAERPVWVGAFYYGDHEAGLNDAINVLFGDGDTKATLDSRKTEWLILPAFDSFVEIIHRKILGLPLEAPAPTLYRHLYDHDGSAIAAQDAATPKLLSALDGFRLRHESPYTVTRDGNRVPAFKIYQRVLGANIEGTCSGPGVRVRAPVTTDVGRRFDYVTFAPCQAGHYQVRMPYPGEVEVARPDVIRVQVSESAVMSGLSVEAR